MNVTSPMMPVGTASTAAADGAEADLLLARALRHDGKFKDAGDHYARAAATSLAAAEEFAAMLLAGGHKREALSLLDTSAQRATASPSDRDRVNAIRQERAKSLTVVSIHQPSYLPWLGLLHKIYYADKFVILDDVKFSKNSFIKRALVKKHDGEREAVYLSMPLKKHSDFAKINELAAADGSDWRGEHLRKIAATYRATPFFKEIFPGLEGVYAGLGGGLPLTEVTEKLLMYLLDVLGIDRPIFYASALGGAEISHDAHQRNMLLVKELGGNVYFSGSVARDYQQGKALPPGMKLVYQDMWNFLEKHPYVAAERFTNGLSALDALFNIGPEKIVAMFERYEDPLVTRDHLFVDHGTAEQRPTGDAASLGAAI